MCLLLAQVSKSTLCSRKKTKPLKMAPILAFTRERNIFISDEWFEKCENFFLTYLMYLTLLYNSVIHVLSSPMTRAGDNKPYYDQKVGFCAFGRVKGG